MHKNVFINSLISNKLNGGDDDGDWDDSTMSEQGNGADSDNLPTWQQ